MKTITYLSTILLCSSAIAQQYVNGTMSTGTITKSGVTAPAGRTWAELQHEGNDLSTTNFLFGMGIEGPPTYSTRFVDDFSIPAELLHIQTQPKIICFSDQPETSKLSSAICAV